MTLRRQLFLVLSMLFLAVLSAVLIVSVSGTRQYLEQQLALHAQDAATSMSVSLGQTLGAGDVVLAEAQVLSAFDRGYFKRIEVLGPDRKSIVLRELPEKIQGVPAWFVTMVPIVATTGEAFVSSGWRQLGKVLVSSQPTFAYQHLWGTALELLFWLLGFYGVALALSTLLLHFILAPLKAIEKTAIDVQAKRFLQIDMLPRAPELARVVMAMNQMSRRVGEMLDSESAKTELLRKQAYDDESTGLANRRGYELRLTELLEGEHRFSLGAVIAVELDDMRLLIRAHGFEAGGRILQAVASNGQAIFGEMPGAILARSNEFSFSFVLTDMSLVEVSELASELRRRIISELANDTPAKMVAINVGVAFFHDQDSCSDVFARADLAVQTARQSKRNGFVILPDKQDDNSSLGSSGWRTLIQSALTGNRWQLVWQPVVLFNRDRDLVHSECMARLVDGAGALVPASSFMPMAVRHRLMPEVDRAMVTLALAHLRGDALGQAMVAINLSPQSIADAEFMEWLGSRLQAVGTQGTRVAMEVSGFGALRNASAIAGLRDLMRRCGGQFGLDHFGMDQQSLQLLRDVPPDYVKLSGALTSDISAQPQAQQLLASFVKLAHALDVVVIAQQVESATQVTAMVSAGIDGGQGYYLGAPK